MMDHESGVELVRQFLRINSSNPPGNEEESVLFLEALLRKAGIRSEIISPAPRRANLMARIEGKRRGKPVVLLSHVDVVPAIESEWEVDPFGGEIKDGFVYGRGAIDMKTQTICHLLSFIRIHEENLVPENDLIFLATGDEEAGGKFGAEHMLNHVEELRHASFVLSEGGCIMEEDGELYAQVSVAEKKLSQFMVTATGRGGHGSAPHKDSANVKTISAAHAIMSHQWPFRPTPVARAYLDTVLKGKVVNGYKFTNLQEALTENRFRSFLENTPIYNALLRNTVTPTVLRAGEKINVIPAESSIYFDARLLPNESHKTFFKIIRRLVGKSAEVTPISEGRNSPSPSGQNTRYFRGIRKVVEALKGPVPTLPFITTGATDLRYFRDLGIPSYGFSPVTLSADEHLRMHGKNERISVENIEEGILGTYEIVKFLTK
jgi:acetylornithine deacetylase/succinyl-diaminopimelate desuccinylase-like protein